MIPSIKQRQILSITQDHEEKMWIGTVNGLNLMEKNSNGFKEFFTDPADHKFAHKQ